jgi:hypothetical protein
MKPGAVYHKYLEHFVPLCLSEKEKDERDEGVMKTRKELCEQYEKVSKPKEKKYRC